MHQNKQGNLYLALPKSNALLYMNMTVTLAEKVCKLICPHAKNSSAHILPYSKGLSSILARAEGTELQGI